VAREWTLGFVGTGVMAEVMLAALVDQGMRAERLLASHHRADRADELTERYPGLRVTLDNAEAAASDVVVLAVKPQRLADVARGLRGRIPAETLVVSIVAGATVAVLQKALGHGRIVRAMPNLPCRIRQGMTVWAAPGDTAQHDLDRVATVLGAIGQQIRVDDEENVDRATAVSGTGPAIVAHFVKAYLEAANYIGEPRTLGRETVLATLAGTIDMMRRTDDHVAELIDEVTSPGGTTSRALQVLKNGRFSAVLTDAVDAAYQRTKEMRLKIDE
jgi:pyrroline-5-carboxylate reductase